MTGFTNDALKALRRHRWAIFAVLTIGYFFVIRRMGALSYSEGGSSWLIPVGLVVAVAVIVLLFWSRNRKKQREDY